MKSRSANRQFGTVVSHDGTTIAFETVGSGPALILVNGALAYRSFDPSLAKLADLLGDHLTVYNYDRRGKGESGDTLPYAKEREVEDLQVLVEHAGGSAMVFGFSSGGKLSLDVAAVTPGVTRVGVYEVPFMVDEAALGSLEDSERQLKVMIAEGRRDDAVKFFLRDMVKAPRLMVSWMPLMPFWKHMRAVAHTLPYDAAVMGDFSLPTELITSITIPALAVSGDKDKRLLRAAQAVAKHLPNGKFRLLKGQSHNVSMKVLAPELLEFFNVGYTPAD